jgi:hypothetical protein
MVLSRCMKYVFLTCVSKRLTADQSQGLSEANTGGYVLFFFFLFRNSRGMRGVGRTWLIQKKKKKNRKYRRICGPNGIDTWVTMWEIWADNGFCPAFWWLLSGGKGGFSRKSLPAGGGPLGPPSGTQGGT